MDIVAQPGKTGFLYVFNRVTGEPLWPIEERPVPKSDVPGEQSWPTQPIPTKPPPFGVQKFGVDQINPYLDEADKARILDVMAKARNEGIFTPPVVDRTQISVPGAHGSGNWGAAAGDPATGMVYVRAWNGPDTRVLAERGPSSQQGGPPGAALYSRMCYECHGPDRANLPAPAQCSRPTSSGKLFETAKDKCRPSPRARSQRQTWTRLLRTWRIRPAAEAEQASRRGPRGQPGRHLPRVKRDTGDRTEILGPSVECPRSVHPGPNWWPTI